MPKIAVCGCNGVNKVSFVNDFLTQYPMYQKAGESYKKLASEKNVYGSQELQLQILNCMLDDLLTLNKNENVIITHTILDNLVDTMWMNVHLFPDKLSNIDDQFVHRSLALIRQGLHYLDLVIWLPKTPENIINYTNPNDEVFDAEIDNFFAAIEESYQKRKEMVFEFSAPDGVPGMVQIYGNREERMAMTGLYLDPKTGDFLGKNEGDSLIQIPADLQTQVLFDTLTQQVSAPPNSKPAIIDPRTFDPNLKK